jgi:peptidoglycan/LPS O-acetylase OafA/YrhL
MAQYIPLDQQDLPPEHEATGVEAPGYFSRPQWTLLSDKGTWWNFNLKNWLLPALPLFARPGGIQYRSIGPTSYLDALRGYAACIVFISHAFNTEQNSWRNQPFLSLFFNGTGMVALFFIISGYVLGYRLLVQIRRRESERLLNTFTSSTFRRYIRLYLSSCIAIILTLPLVRCQLYNGMIIRLHKNGFWEQLPDCMFDIIRFCNPFADIRGWIHAGHFYPKHLGVLWTIPVEYRGSVALFVFCIAACKLTTRSRMVLTWIVIIACYVWQSVYVSEFLAGLWIADLTLNRHPERLQDGGERARGMGRNQPTAMISSSSQPPPSINYSSRLHPERSTILPKLGHIILLTIGVILIGQPNHGELLGTIWGTFPWRFLHLLHPYWWDPSGLYIFWHGPGAFLVMYALEFYPGPALRKPLHWPISQYIGDLSFGIYLVHVPVVFAVLWHGMHPLRERYLGSDGYLAFLPGVLVTTVAVFAAADYFTRIDTRVVRFARWLEVTLFTTW